GALPAGIYDSTGKVGLSWRVAILPYIEQDTLYKQFKFDEPWDGPNNKKLIPMMPKTYARPGGGQSGQTYYRTFTGPETPFPPPKPGQPGRPAFGVKLNGIIDGTSRTAMVVEAGNPIEWTRPDDLAYTAGGPLPAVGGIFPDGFHVAWCDGSVRFIRGTLPPA